MAQYIGFSTKNADKPRTTNARTGIAGGVGTITQPVLPGKKYRLVDQNLVVQDLINALSIRQGEKVGQPGYGTTLWNFVFEPNTQDVIFNLENEIRRVANQDKRVVLNFIRSYPQENGVLVEIEITIAPYNQAALMSVFFDSNTNTVNLIP